MTHHPNSPPLLWLGWAGFDGAAIKCAIKAARQIHHPNDPVTDRPAIDRPNLYGQGGVQGGDPAVHPSPKPAIAYVELVCTG